MAHGTLTLDGNLSDDAEKLKHEQDFAQMREQLGAFRAQPVAPFTVPPRATRARVRSVGDRSIRQYGSGSMRFLRGASGSRSPICTQSTRDDHVLNENPLDLWLGQEISAESRVQSDLSLQTLTESESTVSSMAVGHDDEREELTLSDNGEDRELGFDDSDDDVSMEVGPHRFEEDLLFPEELPRAVQDNEVQDLFQPPTPKLSGIKPYVSFQPFPALDASKNPSTDKPFGLDFSRGMSEALPPLKSKYHRANYKEYAPEATKLSSGIKNARITKERNLTGPRWSETTFTDQDISKMEAWSGTTYTDEDMLEHVRQKRSHKTERMKQRKLLKKNKMKMTEEWFLMAGGASEGENYEV